MKVDDISGARETISAAIPIRAITVHLVITIT
jgi:hypothetical protein